MKADLSRTTFDQARRYRSVRMQQGRVQLDADFNEQQDILNHRIEIETLDSLGPVAVPIHSAGFKLTPTPAGTDLDISAGRLYVEGLLCENPTPTTVAHQPDLPEGIPSVPPTEGTYLAYLETWQRHLTPLDLPVDDTSMCEVALGGPDTCTREKTVWQVKLLRVGELGAPLTCLSTPDAWAALTTPPDGRLAARAEASLPPKTPCQLPPEAGYRRLENHLYRVEVHDDGTVTGQALYKWSRDNGSILSRVVRGLNGPLADEFEVASLGRDDVLAITADCWVEFTDDTHELLGQPGPLVQVRSTQGHAVTIDLTTRIGHDLDASWFPSNPRVRRWDGVGNLTPVAIIDTAAGWQEMAQDGIELKFAPGRYRTGDHWLIPARTVTANIEWRQDNGQAAFLPPAGVLRAFARLALLEFRAGAWKTLGDCRPLFPSLGELTQLHYGGGDGQSVKPPPPPNAPAFVALPSKLQVGVANGQFPVAGAHVRFTALQGRFENGSAVQDVETQPDGTASVTWSLVSNPAQTVQHARAELLVAGQVMPGRYLPVDFSAQLALASGIAYDPSGCPDLLAANAYTLQKAVDALCQRTHGGSCCVTVGKGGDHETLDTALRTLLKQGLSDLCLCLLPGDHVLKDSLGLEGSPDHHVLIHGAGPGSRLNLDGQNFAFGTFGALTLQDFTITARGDPRSLIFQKIGDLRLSRMDIAGSSVMGTSLLRVGGCQRLLIEGSRLLASAIKDNTPAFALALADIENACLIDNRLTGQITLFGESDSLPDLNMDRLGRLSGALKTGKVTMKPSGDRLVLERNELQGMLMNGKAISGAIIDAQGSLPVWRHLQVTNNRLHGMQNHYPGVNCAFNGNALEPESISSGDIGVLFASQAKAIGNFAHGEFRMFVVGATPETFGNGGLTVMAV